ncbi:MAG: DNA mismatch repair protein MutS [Flavobacteriaceae bacterium]|nr:DNA mismatch repair protein MutS [Flavobacteriaceae bacterium]
MNWILGLLFILIVVFLINNYSRKKKILKFKNYLIDNWGRPKSEKYFNFYVIGKYFENNNHKKQAFHIISEKCKIDLDIDEIFKFIDRTSSKVGQQYLYYKIRTIGSLENLLKFESLTQIFYANKNLRVKCQLLLSRLNSNDSYYLEELINGKQIEKPKIMWLIYSLSFLAIASIFLSFFNPFFMLFLLPISTINMFFHYRNKGNVNYYLNGVNQLSISLKLGRKLAEFSEIKSHYSDFSFIKKIESIKFRSDFIGFEKHLENEFVFIFWFLIEQIKILFNIELIIFFSFIDSISKEKESIEELFCFIGEIDSAISTASLKSGNLYTCTPIFVKNKQIISKEIYHPLIDNCIPNNLTLIKNSMLLTGSNMSGKTTFIRTLALNSILAQSLNICFAKEYSASFFKVYSSIRISDDILNNTSYYLEEVLTVKKLVEASKSETPCLFVLDEIFKGTNTIERVSGGKAILSFLNKKNHTVLVSTHDIELTDLLEEENYTLYHFSEQIENNELFFDHKLKNGKLKTRNAIKILELYNYPTKIIEDARNTEQNNFS